MSEFIGKRQIQLLMHLRDEWLPRGRSICIVEGFPGVGKTELAERLITLIPCKSVYIECPDKDLDAASDFLAHLGEELSTIGYSALADASPTQRDQLQALVE